MQTLHIAAASLNQTPLSWDSNLANICATVDTAVSHGVQVLCLPELVISGYGCEDMFLADWVMEKAWQQLISLCKKNYPLTIIVGLPLLHLGQRYNVAAIIDHGKLAGIVPKQHLAQEGIYYESRWFKPWAESNETISYEDINIPFGKLFFSIPISGSSFNFGIEICEDAWVKNRPASALIGSGVQNIFNPSASHFALGKLEKRCEISNKLFNSQHHAGLTYILANLLGNEAGRAIYDGSSFIQNTDGITLSKRFSFAQFELISSLGQTSTEAPNENYGYSRVILKPRSTNNTITTIKNESPSFEKSPQLNFHEFTHAVSLGLYDYLRKSEHKRFIISLSGGADSAACAVLTRLALNFAISSRGEALVMKDLGRTDLNGDDYLYCVYQQTKNNSKTTLAAAKAVAHGLNAFFAVCEIDKIVDAYTDSILEVTDKPLSWKKDGIALQNIQARARGPLVWFLANLKQGLLIATSNRSEAAVGYTTMDGDTCGGLSPIGGIDKAFILDWLTWLQGEEAAAYGDFSFLKLVTDQEPTAELKPKESNQTDEKDLMPYKVLDIIENLFIKEKKSPDSILDLLNASPMDYTKEQYIAWLQTFLHLWRINQWKRERYAPSFHLDEASLDPKTWCRYPILSGRLQ